MTQRSQRHLRELFGVDSAGLGKPKPNTRPIIVVKPVITGRPIMGQTLSVTALADGRPRPTVTFQWLANGTPVVTGTTFYVAPQYLGQTIQVRFSASNPSGLTLALSDTVFIISAVDFTPAPIIPGGVPFAGQSIGLSVGANITLTPAVVPVIGRSVEPATTRELIVTGASVPVLGADVVLTQGTGGWGFLAARVPVAGSFISAHPNLGINITALPVPITGLNVQITAGLKAVITASAVPVVGASILLTRGYVNPIVPATLPIFGGFSITRRGYVEQITPSAVPITSRSLVPVYTRTTVSTFDSTSGFTFDRTGEPTFDRTA